MSSETRTVENEPVDIYRDTPIRLLGYANEVGEAFRSLVHVNIVRLSYVVASSYVVADTFDKSSKMHNRQHKNVVERRQKVTMTAVDTVLWQAFASVIVPGFTINRLCYLNAILLRKLTSWPITVRKWTTTAVGLAAIPFIVKPIDHSVHFVMDRSVRPLCGIESTHTSN